MTKLGRVSAAVLAVLLLATGCSKSSSTESPGTQAPGGSGSASPTTITIGTDTANDHGVAAVTGQSSLVMGQNDFYFEPTVITGSAGQTLTIHLTNNGSVPHTFTSDTLKIDDTLSPGQTMDVQVTFPDSGFTEFYCRFHRSKGMVGELTVS